MELIKRKYNYLFITLTVISMLVSISVSSATIFETLKGTDEIVQRNNALQSEFPALQRQIQSKEKEMSEALKRIEKYGKNRIDGKLVEKIVSEYVDLLKKIGIDIMSSSLEKETGYVNVATIRLRLNCHEDMLPSYMELAKHFFKKSFYIKGAVADKNRLEIKIEIFKKIDL